MRAISFKEVSVAFPSQNGEVEALRDVSLEIEAGSFTCLLGPSGCGKSTLLNILAGLIVPSKGEATLAGRPIGRDTLPGIGYMLARDALMPWRSALANVELGLQIQGISRAERKERSRHFLKMLGLERSEMQYPSQLSHGMRQRVAVARTLAMSPDVLLMDEPFAALDAQTRRLVQLEFLSLWRVQRQTVLFVTHDVVEAVSLGDRVVVLTGQPGRVAADYDMRGVERNRNIDAPIDPALVDHYTKIWNDLRAVDAASTPGGKS